MHMNSLFIFLSPFEQFIVTPYFHLNFFLYEKFFVYFLLFPVDLTISNITIVLFIIYFTAKFALRVSKHHLDGAFNLLPGSIQSHFHLGYLAVQATLQKHVHVKYYQQAVFPITLSLTLFLLLLNLTGNFPIFMSLTSQFAVISAFSLPSIFGIFFWLLHDRGLTFFRSFHAPGMSRMLGITLFPIELLTYVMRPVSIICRLCANIMSGHVIMKVILQSLYAIEGLSIVDYADSGKTIVLEEFNWMWRFSFPCEIALILVCLFPLLILELAVSVIQVYVFLVMFCMFLADTFGHHYRH